tara:strand:- start:1231 stop:1506 length:276 start_codon:yes stop_codon:yes gene_type:complete
MTRDNLANLIKADLKITKIEADQAVVSVLDGIKQGLLEDGEMVLRGFGTFRVRSKSERPGRNPKTGVPTIISARKVVTFKSSKLLHGTVNV